MATTRAAPLKLIPRAGGGFKTAEFDNDDCLIDSVIPDVALNEIELPRARSTRLTQGDRIRQGGVSYILTSNSTINLSANATVSDTLLSSRFTSVADLAGSGGATLAAGRGIGITTEGNISTISELPFFGKLDLFLGFRNDVLDEDVVLGGTTYTAQAYLQNNGTETWYFIPGVNITAQVSGDRFDPGDGFWTNADLFGGVTPDSTNSFNLIG